MALEVKPFLETIQKAKAVADLCHSERCYTSKPDVNIHWVRTNKSVLGQKHFVCSGSAAAALQVNRDAPIQFGRDKENKEHPNWGIIRTTSVEVVRTWDFSES